MSSRFTFLTVYSNLASDENKEQINYHNSLFLQLTLCTKLSRQAGGDRNGRMLSYGKIRTGGEIRGVKVYVDIAGKLHTTSPSRWEGEKTGGGETLILRTRLLLVLVELVGGSHKRRQVIICRCLTEFGITLAPSSLDP